MPDCHLFWQSTELYHAKGTVQVLWRLVGCFRQTFSYQTRCNRRLRLRNRRLFFVAFSQVLIGLIAGPRFNVKTPIRL